MARKYQQILISKINLINTTGQMLIFEGPSTESPMLKHGNKTISNIHLNTFVGTVSLFIYDLKTLKSKINYMIELLDPSHVTAISNKTIEIVFPSSWCVYNGTAHCVLNITSLPGLFPNITVIDYNYIGPDNPVCLYAGISIYTLKF